MENYELNNVEFQYSDYSIFDKYIFSFYSAEFGLVEYSDIEIFPFGTPECVSYRVDCADYGSFYLFPCNIPEWDATEVETDAGTFPAGLWQTIAEWLLKQI